MSLFAAVQAACLASYGVLVLLAARQDLRMRRIADGLALAVAGSYVLWALSGLALATLTASALAFALLAAAGLFGAGACAFALGAMGGGDVKLLAAAGLFAGPGLMADFLLVTAVVSGVLAIA